MILSSRPRWAFVAGLISPSSPISVSTSDSEPEESRAESFELACDDAPVSSWTDDESLENLDLSVNFSPCCAGAICNGMAPHSEGSRTAVHGVRKLNALGDPVGEETDEEP